MNKFEEKLHKIADKLFQDIKNNILPYGDLGLLTGSTGIIIFCRHYLNIYPDAKKEIILSTYMNVFFEQLISGMKLLTFCSGLTGVLSGLRYMNEEKLIDIDYSDIELNYKKYLQHFSLQNIQSGNYDFLHGGIGAIKYFANSPKFVNQALDALDEVAEKEGDTYKWQSYMPTDNNYGYNISLSHGIASIVSVMSLLTDIGIDYNKRDKILIGACNYILMQEMRSDRYGCYFPALFTQTSGQSTTITSRLGWCYGDLGIATSLWQAGRVLHNQIWQDKAIEIFTFSATRRDLNDCKIVDSGLCHGSSSAYMMFEYMHQQTGRPIFKEASSYWMDKTLEMGEASDGLAGYMSWKGHKNTWERDYSLLEGISGVGLAILTKLGYMDIRWMNFFLLN